MEAPKASDIDVQSPDVEPDCLQPSQAFVAIPTDSGSSEHLVGLEELNSKSCTPQATIKKFQAGAETLSFLF